MITNFSWLLSVSIKFSSVTLCNQSEESDMSFVTLSFIAETFLFLYVVWAILTWFSVYANVELCFRFPMQVAWSFSLPMLSTLTWTQKLLITHTYKPTKTLLVCWPSSFLFIASLCLRYIAAYFQIFTMLCSCRTWKPNQDLMMP